MWVREGGKGRGDGAAGTHVAAEAHLHVRAHAVDDVAQLGQGQGHALAHRLAQSDTLLGEVGGQPAVLPVGAVPGLHGTVGGA